MKSKTIQSSLLLLSLTALFSAVAAVCIGTGVIAEEEPIVAETKMSVTIGEGITVRYLCSLPEGYTSPVAQIGGEKLEEEYTDEGYIFVYEGGTALTAGEELPLTVTAFNGEGERVTVASRTTSVADYWHTVTGSRSGTSVSDISLRSMGANFLNYCVALQAYTGYEGEAVVLSDVEKSLVYSYDNAISSSWWLRDLTQGESADGFAWIDDVAVDYETGALTFRCTSQTTPTKAVISVAGNKYEISSVQEDGEYTFTTRALKPTEYCEETTIVVYGAEGKLGQATYTFNRALDKLHYNTEGAEQTAIDGLYALGKASVWAAYVNEYGYYDRLAAMGDNGIVTFSYFDYTYDDARMLVSAPWGQAQTDTARVTVGGQMYSLNEENRVIACVEGQGYGYVDSSSVDYDEEENTFTVTLNGGIVDGGIAVYGANLKLRLLEDTEIRGGAYLDWNDKSTKTSACIRADQTELRIEGETGKTLTLVGGSIENDGDFSVENISIVIEQAKKDKAGLVVEGDLKVIGGGLTVNYIGYQTTNGTALEVTGNVTLENATLCSEGFAQGLLLQGDTAENGLSVTQSKVEISARDYAINSTGVDGNRQAVFESGEIALDAGAGIDGMDVTVNSATLNITARTGNGIGSEKYVCLTTVSGDQTVGEINITTYGTYNPYWDMYGRAINASGIAMNGGTLNITIVYNKSAIVSDENAVMNFSNCDVNIEMVYDGYCFLLNNGGEVVTVENTAKIVLKHCDMPFASWSYYAGKTTSVCNNGGGIWTDGYRNPLGNEGDRIEWTGDEIRYYGGVWTLEA